MDDHELGQRAEAWTRASLLLGMELDADRLDLLVDATREIPVADLWPAIEDRIKAADDGFLPAPGPVIVAAKRMYGERRQAERDRQAQAARIAAHSAAAIAGSPGGAITAEGWDLETTKAFVIRMGVDPGYAARVLRVIAQRHLWVAKQEIEELGHRRANAHFRIATHRRLNAEAEHHFPRPDPLADGWRPPDGADPIRALIRGVTA